MPKRFIRTVAICLLVVISAFIAVPESARADQVQDCVQHADLDLQVRACSEVHQRDNQAAWAYINRSWALHGQGRAG